MKIRNYCIAVIDNVAGVKEEIANISESAVKYVDGKGLIIATFSSYGAVSDLHGYFTEKNRSFLLFELGPDNYSASFTRDNIYSHLFGNLDKRGLNPFLVVKQKLSEMKNAKDVKNTISATTATTEIVIPAKQKSEPTTEEDIKLQINELLDKGFENLTEKEKKLLAKLSKKIKK